MSPRETVPHVVYRCYDTAGRLLYIGCSNSIRARLDAHEDTSWWWPEVATVRNLLFPNRDTAREKERQAIFHERPRCNVKGRWYKRDPRADWSAQDYIEYHETVRRTANGIYGRTPRSSCPASSSKRTSVTES